MGAVFLVYRQIRHLTSGDLDGAMLNADRVVDVERWFGVFNERALQELVMRSQLAIEFLDHYYVLVHFPASVGFLVWIFFRHPQAYGRIRAWFLGVTLAGLAIHVAYPLAPPRMLDQHGFVDTLHEFGPRIYSQDVTASAANQLAAMPSLHFAWAALVAAGVLHVRGSRWSLLVLLHPVITLLAIVATANHYWADAFVGGLLVVAAIVVTRVLWRSRPTFEQVPAIAPWVLEDDDRSVRFVARCLQEDGTRGQHPAVRHVELVRGEEEPDAATRLVADAGALTVVDGASEQQCRPATVGGADHDPALLTVLRYVFDDDEAQHSGEEVDAAVVVVDDERDEGDVFHGPRSHSSRCTTRARGVTAICDR